MKRIICFFLGHYTGVTKIRPGKIEGFGGFYITPSKSKRILIKCLRCGISLNIKKRITKFI